MDIILTPEQLQILQHALGVDQYGQTPKGFTPFTRNRFCAGGDDEAICRSLIDLGLMRQHKTTEVFPYFNCSVTDLGIAAMKQNSPKPPKLTRSQQCYRAFLAADSGMSFIEWIKRTSLRDRAEPYASF